jgi:RecG-like helicase
VGFFERFARRLTATDEQLLAEEIQSWAAEIPGTVRIGDCTPRTPVKVAGVVKRITVTPAQGSESLEAVISDGTGEISVVWMGRRSIPGLNLGTHVVVQGVVAEERSGRRMVNPSFEFSA